MAVLKGDLGEVKALRWAVLAGVLSLRVNGLDDEEEALADTRGLTGALAFALVRGFAGLEEFLTPLDRTYSQP